MILQFEFILYFLSRVKKKKFLTTLVWVREGAWEIS
jgi:hypothetical protein